MDIVTLPIEQLIPYARNPRRNEDAVATLAASLAEYGWRQPIVVDEHMTIVAGHTRWAAAKRLGMKQVPVHIARNLTAAQVKAYRLMDNRSHENAEWDDDLLKPELEELNLTDLDLSLTGFDEADLARLLDSALNGPEDADQAPEPPAEPVSRPGDFWICGEHRVLCGDATVLNDVEKLLDGELTDMAFMDPPYNVNYANSTQDKARGKSRPILNDALGAEFGALLYDASVNILTVTKGAVYICMSSSELDTLQKAFREAGGKWSTFVIWAKNTFTLGQSDYQRQYEPILYGWKEGADHYWRGARDQGDVWHFDKPARNDLHPTMKPVALVERAIRNSSKSRDIVLDPFGGSGTTLIAAARLGRRVRLVELDPKYVDVIVGRWQTLSGKAAKLEDGTPYPQVHSPIAATHHK